LVALGPTDYTDLVYVTDNALIAWYRIQLEAHACKPEMHMAVAMALVFYKQIHELCRLIGGGI